MANVRKPVVTAQGIAPYGIRWSDKTTGQPPVQAKELGYFGKIPTSSGAPMTEFSTVFDIDGKLVQAPLVVPTLTPQEIQMLQSGAQVPESIYQKAQQHAVSRIQQGRDPFATGRDLRRPVGYKYGGIVDSVYDNSSANNSVQGENMAPNSTTSMDLPPVLAQLLGPMTSPVTQSPTMQMPPMQQAFNPASSGMSAGMTRDNAMMPGYAMGGMVDSGGMASAMTQQQPMQTFMPSYAVGGMVGADGMPEGGLGAPGMPQGGMPQMVGAGGGAVGLQEGGGQQPRMTLQQADMQIADFIRNRPREVAQIQAVVQAGLQAGEFTMDDINMMEQMAITALQNPEMYPNIRQLAIQQGFAVEEDLSLEYDEGLIYTVLVAARVAKQGGGVPAGGDPMGGMQAPNFAFGGMVDDKTVRPGDMAAEGGGVEGPGTGTSDSVPIRVSTGEYVIPANVVRMKGKEFFDSMLEKYKDT